MTPSTKDFENRRERLRRSLRDAGLDALLVSHAANRFYLSGFELHDPQCNESAGYLLVTASGRDILMTDPRYLDAARRLWPEEDVFIYSGARYAKMREFLAGLGAGAVGFESRSVSYEMHQELSQALDLRPTVGLIENLRLIKDAAEIKALRESCALNHDVFAGLPRSIRPGMTEADIAWSIEQDFRRLGASELSFAPIVAVGRNAALPHAIPGSAVVRDESLVLVDVGGRHGEYCSDQTRTLWIGKNPTPEFQRTLAQVQEAQAKAIEVIRPGLPIREAYFIARKVFERYGVESKFTHSLGHGIGLETHESPSVSPLAQGVFQPGMVVTVEPGLYYPEWGGVRWEYMALITENGVSIL